MARRAWRAPYRYRRETSLMKYTFDSWTKQTISRQRGACQEGRAGLSKYRAILLGSSSVAV